LVAKHILERGPESRRHINWPEGHEAEVTHRIVLEISRHLVASAERFPGFTAALAAPQLSRIKTIASSVQHSEIAVADEIDSRRLQAKRRISAEYERTYREIVASSLDEVDIMASTSPMRRLVISPYQWRTSHFGCHKRGRGPLRPNGRRNGV